jgi:hypothetical protein
VVVVFTFLFALLLRRWPAAGQRGVPGQSLRRGWVRAAAFLVLFILVHLNSTMRNMDPVLYIPVRYAAWKREVQLAAELQAKMAAVITDPVSTLCV